MKAKGFDVNSLRVASPCPVGWETMSGDQRVRHCGSCELNVYNISAMTSAEAERLIVNRGGRLCIRLYKRADGTVLTQDCPVGLRAYRKRVAKFAGAALTAVLGLFSVSFGQQKADGKVIDASKVKIAKTVTSNQESSLTGSVVDQQGAVIPGAKVVISGSQDLVRKTTSDENGLFTFTGLPAGIYRLNVSRAGFAPSIVENLKIGDREKNEIKVVLYAKPQEVVGLLGIEYPVEIDPTTSSITTVITPRMIEKLPH
jgi:hypothetical protein